MKSIQLVVLLILLSFYSPNIFAGEDLKADLIPNKFTNIGDLKKWAETSTFGGGILIKLQGNHDIYYIVDRLHTSGMPTSEAIFYKKEKGSFKMIYYLPFKYVTRKFEFKNDRVVVTENNLKNEQRKLLISENEL